MMACQPLLVSKAGQDMVQLFYQTQVSQSMQVVLDLIWPHLHIEVEHDRHHGEPDC